MANWNYRVFRSSDPDGSPVYDVRETHYDEAQITGWTEREVAPTGETVRELARDIGWFIAALSKPVLDAKTGLECEPAKMLADDLQKFVSTAEEIDDG